MKLLQLFKLRLNRRIQATLDFQCHESGYSYLSERDSYMKRHRARHAKLIEKLDSLGRFWGPIHRWLEVNKRLPTLMEMLVSHEIWICKCCNYTDGDRKALLNRIGHCHKELNSKQEKNNIICNAILLFELAQISETSSTDTSHPDSFTLSATPVSAIQPTVTLSSQSPDVIQHNSEMFDSVNCSQHKNNHSHNMALQNESYYLNNNTNNSDNSKSTKPSPSVQANISLPATNSAVSFSNDIESSINASADHTQYPTLTALQVTSHKCFNASTISLCKANADIFDALIKFTLSLEDDQFFHHLSMPKKSPLHRENIAPPKIEDFISCYLMSADINKWPPFTQKHFCPYCLKQFSNKTDYNVHYCNVYELHHHKNELLDTLQAMTGDLLECRCILPSGTSTEFKRINCICNVP